MTSTLVVLVILIAAKDLARNRRRSFAALRMTVPKSPCQSMFNVRWICSNEMPLVSGITRSTQTSWSTVIAQ